MKPNDLWETPPALFAELSERFGGFDLDPAATVETALCTHFYTPETDGLRSEWFGRVFCNPPFSECGAWVEKAWAEWRFGCGRIVMLLPAHRTEQPWWQTHVEPYRDRGAGLKVEFIAKRVVYLKNGKRVGSPKFGSCLLIWS